MKGIALKGDSEGSWSFEAFSTEAPLREGSRILSLRDYSHLVWSASLCSVGSHAEECISILSLWAFLTSAGRQARRPLHRPQSEVHARVW